MGRFRGYPRGRMMGPRFGRPPFGMFPRHPGPMGPMGPMGGPMGPRGPMRPMMGGPMRPPMMMRPRPPHGGGPPPRHPPKGFFVSHQSFDALMADSHFGKACGEVDDTALNAALVRKTQELTPTPTEQSSVQNFVSKVETVVEALILSPTDLNVPIDEVRTVGSYKKGTMLAGHPVADLVIILKETPGASDIENLASKVQEKLKANTPGEEFPTQANEGGFNTTSSEGALVRALVTTIPKNLFVVDAEKHVDVKLLEGALATIRHARWFEENASHTTVRVMVRVLKDLKKRFLGLSGLTPWLIDLLAFNSTQLPSQNREPLAINVAFRRALQLLASGIFLPGSIGFIDPCETGHVRSHSVLGLEEQDQLCLTAQTLLRCLAHGAVDEIFGIDGQLVALDTDITSWGGTIVTPGQEAYNKDEHKKESMLVEEMEANGEKEGDGKKMET